VSTPLNSARPTIAITMGDPAGIGPEIIAKALAKPELRTMARLLVVGDRTIMERAVALTGVALNVVTVPRAADTGNDPGTLYLHDLRNLNHSAFEYGRLSGMCGQAAYEAIESAISLALDGSVQATVTAPINKEALKLAGIPYAGHTEIFADKTRTVVHVSTHLSLREACDRVTEDRVARVIGLADEAVRRLGVRTPTIAVAGLNPHAGENGLFGREEIEQIAPAIRAARSGGMKIVGPLPPDTLFPRAAAGEYDCVVAMYHDQGHIPLKLLGFTYDKSAEGFTDVKGVNITLGLPIIRTSVDHGTAFDKAGTGVASETSIVQAIRYASRLTKQTPQKE